MRLSDLNSKNHELTESQELSLVQLSEKCTELEKLFGSAWTVTSGFRTKQEQMRINPHNPRSSHLEGRAVDISDPEGTIWNWLTDNMDLLVKLGIYLESRTVTPRYVHLTTRAPKSGLRIFMP